MNFAIRPVRNAEGKITAWCTYKMPEGGGQVEQLDKCFGFDDACRSLEEWSQSNDPTIEKQIIMAYKIRQVAANTELRSSDRSVATYDIEKYDERGPIGRVRAQYTPGGYGDTPEKIVVLRGSLLLWKHEVGEIIKTGGLSTEDKREQRHGRLGCTIRLSGVCLHYIFMVSAATDRGYEMVNIPFADFFHALKVAGIELVLIGAYFGFVWLYWS